MRYAIFADIHSNLEALEAVLAVLSSERIDAYLCAGDIVGYGADPKPCLGKVKALTNNIVAGNHESAVCGKFPLSDLVDNVRDAVLWTKNILSAEETSFLNNLALVYKNNDLTLVHASLDSPQDFYYIFKPYEAGETFDLLDTLICFFGHTHRPQILVKRNIIISRLDGFKAEINPDYKYTVNVGSVGQPRDGDPRAAYCIYDTAENTIEIKRIPYDIETAQRKIIAAGLPRILAERLAIGR